MSVLRRHNSVMHNQILRNSMINSIDGAVRLRRNENNSVRNHTDNANERDANQSSSGSEMESQGLNRTHSFSEHTMNHAGHKITMEQMSRLVNPPMRPDTPNDQVLNRRVSQIRTRLQDTTK